MRPITSDLSTAVYAVDYFVQIGVEKVCVVYLEDEWGTNYQLEFSNYARNAGLAFYSFEARPGVVDRLVDRNCQNFFAIVFNLDYLFSGGEATAAGLNGADNLWIFADGLPDLWKEMLRYFWPISKG